MNCSERIEDEESSPSDYIASFIWSSGVISAVFYNISSMDLFVAHETVDLKPDFWHLRNIFRQMKMINVIASGPTAFLQQIMKLLGKPEKDDPNRYRLNRLKTLSAAEFIVYSNNDKNLIANRKRILEMQLPRMSSDFSEQDRCNFIQSIIPLHQNLVVQCLGNLLNYLDMNWRHLFLRTDSRPIITDVHTYQMESHVLMDESTFDAMQIFAPKDHPSGFKMSDNEPASEGLSLYSLMNTCVSRMGSNELKLMLQRPTRDFQELQKRFSTIEWLRNENNMIQLTKFNLYLKNIGNVGDIYAKLVRTHGKPSIWKSFRRTIFSAKCLGELCLELFDADSNDTIISEFGGIFKDNHSCEYILKLVDIIVDLEESLKLSKFCVKFGLDAKLDEMKDSFFKVIQLLSSKIESEINSLPEFINEVTVHYVNEMGFLIGEQEFPVSPPISHSIHSQLFQLSSNQLHRWHFFDRLCNWSLSTEQKIHSISRMRSANS